MLILRVSLTHIPRASGQSRGYVAEISVGKYGLSSQNPLYKFKILVGLTLYKDHF